MFLGMLTTAATFYGLVFVDFPTLRQLGLLIGHSMVACGILTLLLIPALLPRRPSALARFKPLEWHWLAGWIRRRRVALLAVTAVPTLLLGAASFRLRVNASLDRLKSTTPAAVAEERVEHLFGLPSDIYVVLQEGPDLQRLLEENERFIAELRPRRRRSRSTRARRFCRHKRGNQPPSRESASRRRRLRWFLRHSATRPRPRVSVRARSRRSRTGCRGCSRPIRGSPLRNFNDMASAIFSASSSCMVKADGRLRATPFLPAPLKPTS